MVSFHVFAKPHFRQTHRSYTTSALPLPCSLFNSPSKVPALSASPVTKSPVVHPLSVQLLTKCYSRNSFVLKTIRFDGGCAPPVPRPSHRPAPTLSGSRVTSHSSPATKHKLTIWIYGFSRNDRGRPAQYAIGPTSFSTSAISTMTMASHGQPSRKQPSGPLLRHFLHPMHWMGSIWMRPNGGLSSSGTQNMQSSTRQYSTQAGDPAQPVQHSVITASSFGLFLRALEISFAPGSNFCSSGTNPGAFTTCCSAAMELDFTSKVRLCNRDSRGRHGRFWLDSRMLPLLRSPRAGLSRTFGLVHYNASAIQSVVERPNALQIALQTSIAGAPRGARFAPLLYLALPFLLRRYGLLRRAGPHLALARRLLLLLPRADSSLQCRRA